MAMKAFLADPYTRSILGKHGLEELSRNLWPGHCQTCGFPLGTEPPAVVIVDEEVSITANLHHRRCQHPRWTKVDPPPSRRHLSTTVAFLGIPFGDPARAPFSPTLLANPGLEEVTLARDRDGQYRATTVAAYRPWGLLPPGATLARADPDAVCCWMTETALVARCGPMHWYVSPAPDEQTADAIRRRGDIVVAVSTALDPAQLRNPEPVKRVLGTGHIAAVRAPLLTSKAPALTGHTIVIESDFAHADETRDDDWLNEVMPYAGPTYDPRTGRFAFGTTMDGPAYWTLNTPGGRVENGLLAGPEGSGKTNTLRIVGLEAIASGVFAVAVADPRNRNQLVDLFAPAAEKVARSPQDTVRLLSWGADAVERRQPTAAQYRVPSRARPGLLLLLDDAHEVLVDPSVAALAERIATAGPGVGVGVVVASRSVDIGDFAGRRGLLNALAATNCAVFDKEMADQLHRTRRKT